MGRNGHSTATTATAEPDDLYDELNQDAKDQWDAMGGLGFTPEKGAAGLWFARKPDQTAKQAIGPADSLSSLLSQVKASLPTEQPDDRVFDDSDLEEMQAELEDDLDNPEMIELEDDGDGNRYLPGQAPKVIKALAHDPQLRRDQAGPCGAFEQGSDGEERPGIPAQAL